MEKSNNYDITVIGGGPAGLAAAIEAKKGGAEVLLIERESRLGGILKQCIHDGFGLVRYGEKLSGPEYAQRFITEFEKLNIDLRLNNFVTDIKREENIFNISVVSSLGVEHIKTDAIVFATGCRERTPRQVAIHGTRPSGIYTAGNAQNFMNLLGEKVAKKAVILGSGDIGLIMARRLTLEGSEVVGVFEALDKPSRLTRNIQQCLVDYGIPIYLRETVTRVFGDKRVEAVEIAKVDEKMNPIEGTEKIIPCDTLIVSVGLIPENELIEKLKPEMDPMTKGPKADENGETSVPGIFTCGNSYHVFDLVDYVTVSGETAGRSAVDYVNNLKTKGIFPLKDFKPVEIPAPEKGGKLAKEGNFICIVCPKGCEVEVVTKEGPDGMIYATKGNGCQRGHDFVVNEVTKPKRTICSTVKTDNKEIPVLPVRVSRDIPKDMIFRVMEEINKITVKGSVSVGEVLLENVLDTGANIISTSEIK